MRDYFPESHAPTKIDWFSKLTKPFNAEWRRSDGSYRYRWGEFAWGFGIGLNLYHYEEPGLMIWPLFGKFYIRLKPRKWTERLWSRKDLCSIDNPQWGFSLAFFKEFAGTLMVHWGRKSKHIDLHPLTWGRYRREYISRVGLWYPYDKMPQDWHSPETKMTMGPQPWKETHKYHYMTAQGEAQHVDATIRRERVFMTRMLFRKIPLWTKERHSIEVSFSEEVGNQRGSWKGGVVGCGYDMKPGEEPFQTLRRMQRERNFDR